MKTRDYFRLGYINNRGIAGDLNEGVNGWPIYNADEGEDNGLDHRYIVNLMKGTLGYIPYLKSYMGSNSTNSMLGMEITSQDTKGKYTGQPIDSMLFQILPSYLMILDGEVKGINIALSCIGNSGVMETPYDLFNDDEEYTGWNYTSASIIDTNRGTPGGEIYELSRDLYGIGGTNSLLGYIDESGTIVSSSRNTDCAITTRSSDSDVYSIPYNIGLYNRFERFQRMIHDGDAGLNPLGGSAHAYSYSSTVKLFCHQGTQPTITDPYLGGYLEGSTEGYPVALLSAISDYNRINVTLQVLREPYTDSDIDDEWYVNLGSGMAAKVTVTFTEIGSTGVFKANWNLYVYNLDTINVPCLVQTFTPSTTSINWNSTTRTYRVSFITDCRGDGNGYGLPVSVPSIIRVEGILEQ